GPRVGRPQSRRVKHLEAAHILSAPEVAPRAEEERAVSKVYHPAKELRGMYRDVLRDPSGRVTWDSGWHQNAIVADCRRLLAALVRGGTNASGIQGVQVGSGSDAWDQAGM